MKLISSNLKHSNIPVWLIGLVLLYAICITVAVEILITFEWRSWKKALAVVFAPFFLLWFIVRLFAVST